MDVKSTISKEEVAALEQWAREAKKWEMVRTDEWPDTILSLCETVRAQQADLAFHADCRPNRRQAEAAMADAKATNDRWADEVRRREEAEATIAHLRASERDTREVLWLGHGHTGQYGDDGEMQCGACLPHYDYKGRPLADVARTALGALRTENTTLRAERDEARLEVKNAYNLFPPLLHAIDVALNGPAPDGVMRGYSTLPRQVEALRAALAAAQEVLRDIQGRPWPHRAGCVMFTSGYPLPCDCGLTDIETRISAALAQAAPAQGGEQ